MINLVRGVVLMAIPLFFFDLTFYGFRVIDTLQLRIVTFPATFVRSIKDDGRFWYVGFRTVCSRGIYESLPSL